MGPGFQGNTNTHSEQKNIQYGTTGWRSNAKKNMKGWGGGDSGAAYKQFQIQVSTTKELGSDSFPVTCIFIQQK